MEMEFSSSRPASPRSTPSRSASPPAMQTKEVCDTRRMLEQRLDILRAQHDEAYAYLCHIEEKFQDTTSEFYQGAYAMYKSAEQARTKAEGEYDLFPYCPIPGCPYHTKLPKSPNKNNKQKRTDEEGYITPPSRKQAKKSFVEQHIPQIAETNNKFKKLQINTQEISENSQHDEITEEPVPQLKEKLPPPVDSPSSAALCWSGLGLRA
ncbi:hypothetical protein NPIL_65381 [Nephila pilipes]|uniref:Uncharacterized protein n=2 Tax=Nephila pilipes TaxID=299642 RepID=A0A8X6P421_NEPPI|nr:hypothetical protein NPIL_65381 [Nephila pilipes]